MKYLLYLVKFYYSSYRNNKSRENLLYWSNRLIIDRRKLRVASKEKKYSFVNSLKDKSSQ